MTNLLGTIYLVDDDPGVRRSIGRLLCATGHRVQEFESCRSFLDAVDEQTPGCLLLDLQLRDIDGLELQQLLARSSSSRPIVFLTGHATVSASVQAMKAGAVDFLTKPVERGRLLAAVSEALAVDAVQRDQTRARDAVRERIARLSPREYEVLLHLIRGRLNKQIAGDLGVVEKTIKVHRGRVLKKMGVRCLVELAQMVSLAGITPNRIAPRSAVSAVS